MRLLSILALPTLAFAATLHLSIPPSTLLPNPATLPPSTHATLSTLGQSHTALLQRNNAFTFNNVSAGSYLLDINCRDYHFAPLRVDVGAEEKVEVWQTFRGNEWDNKGEKVGEGVGSCRAEGRVVGGKAFYEARSGFSPMSLLQNPMILLAVVGFGLMVGMPYLLDSMDPEMKKEFEEHQKKSPLGGAIGGGAAGGNPLQNFDMAAWMAGTPAKSSSAENEEAARSRKRN